MTDINTGVSAQHEAMQRLGADIVAVYAELCPPQLAHLAFALKIDKDCIVFETLDAAIARKANLDLIWPRWALWLFEAELKKYPASASVAALFRRVVAGGDLPTRAEIEKISNLTSEVTGQGARPSWTASAAAWTAVRASSEDVTASARTAAWALRTSQQSMVKFRMYKKLQQLLREAS